MITLIVAPNYKIARDHAENLKLTKREWKFVSGLIDVYGIGDFRLEKVMVPGENFTREQNQALDYLEMLDRRK